MTAEEGPQSLTAPDCPPELEVAQERERVPAAAGIVLAPARAGRGSFSPCWADLLGRPVCAWAVEALEAAPEIGEVALVVPASRLRAARALVTASDWRAVRVAAVPAGIPPTPSAQVRAGLAALQSNCAVIVMQEGARPLLALDVLAEALRRANEQSVIVAATPVTETIKWADASGLVRLTPPRASLWQLQTPLVAPRPAIEAALSLSGAPAPAADAPASALAWLLECWGEARAGLPARHGARLAVRLVRADSGDLLVRRRADLAVAAALVQARMATSRT